ncbi:MAG: flagellar basal body-associated protein FliL [Desulfohalobiaceae bacterium]
MAKAKNQKQEPSQEPEKKKRSKLKMLLLALAVIVLLAGLGGAGYWGYNTFLASSQNGQSSSAEEQGGEQKERDSDSTELVSLPTLLVNLADPLGKRYVKVSIDLEVEDKKAESRIQDNKSRIKDTLILLLSSKTFSDLSKMEDKLALKGEIVERINQILEKSVVQEVYFTEFVIQ